MSEIEKDFEAVRKEISDKIDEAVKLLQEAAHLAENNRLWSAFEGNKYPGFKSAVFEFFEIDDDGWVCSF